MAARAAAPSPAEDRAAFIRANTRLLAPPLAPEMRLHLADDAVALWTKTEAELQASGLPPPFWAFAWAGGQALARWIGDHPGRIAGRRALDFASGSGIVAIAAALAGAGKVEASEIDPFAQAAIALNAGENRVAVDVLAEDVFGTDRGWDVVLAGDVAYERDMAAAAFAWLEGLARRGALVLVGDPRRSYLALDRLECVAEYSVPTTRALEDAEIKRTGVFVFKAAREKG
jgi:predicted nicotinamide N-methyase